MPSYSNPFAESQNDWLRWWGDQINNNASMWSTLKGYENNSPSNIYRLFTDATTSTTSKAQRDWLSNQYDSYYNNYLYQQSINPSLWFGSYLGNTSLTNMLRDFSFSSPYERGERPSLYNPTMRMMQ